VLRNAAVRAPGTLMGGGDLQDILVGSLAGEAGKTAAGYLPSTGVNDIDSILRGTVATYAGNELRDILGGSPSAPTRAPSPPPATDVASAPASAPAPASNAPAPAPAPSQDNNLMALLLAMGLLDRDEQPQAPPELFSATQMTTLPGQLSGKIGEQPTSLAELMALLNTRRA